MTAYTPSNDLTSLARRLARGLGHNTRAITELQNELFEKDPVDYRIDKTVYRATGQPDPLRRKIVIGGLVLGAAIVAGLGALYLSRLGNSDDGTPTPTETPTKTNNLPLSIKDYKWVSTYDPNNPKTLQDALISFGIQDGSNPQVELKVTPYFPSELNQAAFPPEDSQDFPSLQVTSFDSSTSTGAYSQKVTVKGGKTYKVGIAATDSSGNKAEINQDSPYVREFENIAKNNKVNIGAHYLFFQSGGWNYWDALNGTPLLGNYDSGDNDVVSKHIDWATGHAINFLPLIWFGPTHYSSSKMKNILLHPLIKDIKFCIFYDSTQLSGPKLGPGPWNVDDPSIRKILLDGLDYLIQNNYFSHPSYFTYQGAHLIYYWGSLSWKGNVDSMTSDLRKKAKESGIDLFIVGDPVQYYQPNIKLIKPFDGITQFLNNSVTDPQINQNLEKMMDANYKAWSSLAKSIDVKFIPSAIPGYRKSIRPDFLTLPRDSNRFKNQLEIDKKYIDPDLNMVFITSFNDWTENHEIEPSKEEDFTYLQIIKDSFT